MRYDTDSGEITSIYKWLRLLHDNNRKWWCSLKGNIVNTTLVYVIALTLMLGPIKTC